MMIEKGYRGIGYGVQEKKSPPVQSGHRWRFPLFFLYPIPLYPFPLEPFQLSPDDKRDLLALYDRSDDACSLSAGLAGVFDQLVGAVGGDADQKAA